MVKEMMIQIETSSLSTLKIMPRNLDEIVSSWIQLKETRALFSLDKQLRDRPVATVSVTTLDG